MSDLISRQAAIDAIEFDITYAKAINKETGEVTQLFERENKALEDAVERIKQLPPIQPEPKMGKWIPVTRIEEWSKEEGLTGFPPEVAEFPNCTIKYVDATEPDEVDAVKCSECGTVFDFTDARNWCSECGADMRGEQDE